MVPNESLKLPWGTRVGIALTILGWVVFGVAVYLHEKEDWTAEKRAVEMARADSIWSKGTFQPERWKGR